MNDYDVAQLARLEPAYQERLGLTSAPFPPTHEDRFLYLDSERLQRLNMLQHLTEYSNLLLLIIGERGIGKTSLLQRFMIDANPDWCICQVDAHTMMSADQLLYDIAKEFGQPSPPRDATSLQDVLYHQLLDLQNKNLEPILIIDDAHELPQDALEAIFLLADVEGRHGNLLRILLFCEPQISTMLERSEIRSLRDRITHTLDIPRLSEEQTAEYIHHRLAVAGLNIDSPFSIKDVRHIYKLSDGIPARVNETAHLLLNESAGIIDPILSDSGNPYNKRSFRVQLIVACLLFIGIGILLFQDDINALFDITGDAATQQPLTKQNTLEFEMPSEQASITAPKKELKNNLKQKNKSDNNKLKSEKESKPIIRKTIITPTEETTQPTASKTISITSITPSPVIGSRQPQTLNIKGDAIPQDSEVHVQWSTGEKTLQSHQVEWLSKNEIQITIATGINADQWKVLISHDSQLSQAFAFKVLAKKKSPKNLTKTIRKQPGSPDGMWDSHWIKQQPAQHFTLQLLASQNVASLKNFIQQHAIKDFAVAFKTQKNNKPLYVLILGSYPDRAQAKQAISQLPSSLKSIKPWIRNYQSIKTSMNTPAQPAKVIPVARTLPVSSQPEAQTAWLWSQDPTHFTLQLISGKNKSAIKSFITQYKLDGNAVYFESFKNNQRRYVLIFGSYLNRTQALSAIKSLPASIQKSEPWARTFASIHSELPAP